MRSFAKPTQNEVETAVQRMRSPELAAYFLSRLENPEWIGPLGERGLLTNPPSSGHWPASKYLARMADHSPTEVSATFAKIETVNASVVGDMLTAALKMPAPAAAKLVPKVAQAADSGKLWPCLKDANDLCVQLAQGGEIEAALALANILFAPSRDDKEKPNRRELHWYKDGLAKAVPVLVSLVPERFLRQLCSWLKDSMEATKHVDSETGTDDSPWWRPAIEEHEQNRQYDVVGELVGFLRQGVETAVATEQMTLNEAIALIEQTPYLVFRRLRLHLINVFAEQTLEKAREAMLDRALFDDHNFKHEYAMLVGARLNLLSDDDRAIWFGWIDAGPDLDGFDESVLEGLGRAATEEDRQGRIRYWQFEKLHCVRDHLDGDRRAFYEEMLTEHGIPELADVNVSFRTGWGITSPLSAEELSAMSFEDAVETVSSWRPEQRGFRAPDVEGLGTSFGQYVADSAVEYSSRADLLVGRPAIYVRAFISKMAEAIAANKAIDVERVLDLCEWVVGRPIEERTTPAGNRDVLVDANWQWSRDEITKLIENVVTATDNDGPRYSMDEYRERIWRLLEQLCQDPTESSVVRDESQEDPRLTEYLLHGINSSRGKAVEAALEYARWIANHIKQIDGDKTELVAGGFDTMPEIREMLERQIRPANRSVEVMAVIGSRIGLISWIDANWLESNCEQLFDLAGLERDPKDECGWAAWNAFLVWGRPHIDFYRMFKGQFAYAVEEARKVAIDEDTHDQPMDHLGRHLVILYGRGQLGLDEDGGVLKNLVTRANAEIRRRMMGFVGQSLENSGSVADEVLDRFRTLWEIYWRESGKSDAAEKPGSWLFGPWFSCGRFPDGWAMEQLERFVEVSPIVEPDDAVVERLAALAETDIARAVRILGALVRGDTEGWRVYGWIDQAREILGKAMTNAGDARQNAIALIDYLGRRGYHQLGDLLP